jgi:hypothetical protein
MNYSLEMINDIIKIKTYQLCSLSHDHIRILNQSLKEVVLCERNDPQDFAHPREYLIENV